MKVLKLGFQVLLLTAISFLGDAICRLLHWSIPGSMVGLVLLFVLLELKVVKLEWFDLGANWLLSYMLLFFVPAAVGIVQYGPLVRTDGLRLLLVIIASTAMVMATTGFLAELFARRKQQKVESPRV